MFQIPSLAGETPQLPRSVWALTAPPLTGFAQIDKNVQADVVIVGGGFLGLSAAIALCEAGRSVAVVDAVEPGWGASGRNNGQVIPGFKWDPDELKAHLGDVDGERLAEFGGNAPNAVFDAIEKYSIDCSPVRNGWIQPTYTSAGIQKIQHRHALWAQRGAPVQMLDAQALPGLLGTPFFKAGWIDHRGGSINPLAYARGLAQAARALGAMVFISTLATGIQREGAGWVVQCAGGRSLRAPRVIVATAAYADSLVPGLRRSIIPVRTAQVATEPLPEHMLRTILPGRQVASDTRRLLTSFRISPDGRLVMGGSGATAGLDHTAVVARLHAAAEKMFGHLGKLPWELAWSGYFAVTKDHIPHIHESRDGIICALGCNGRGIAVSTAMGTLLARRLMGMPMHEMPLKPTPMKPFVFHAFRHVGVAVATRYHGLRDRLDAPAG